MHRTIRVALLAVFTFSPILAQDGLHNSTLTFGVGGEATISRQRGEGSGPVFSGNYEYRVFKYLAVEAGVETLLPQQTTNQLLGVSSPILSGQNLLSYFSPCSTGCVFVTQTNRTRATLIPVGVKGVLPLWSNRVELYMGVGGAYSFQSDLSQMNGMLAQGNIGGRIALDRGHRFWLGASGHFLSNWGPRSQTWASGSMDMGIRF